ncbi:MAG: hypothetical protein KDC95_10865 [Planctomycetes bacterium]|nr:hypothetical protein [Planctomycetota bacterium]
MRTPLTRPLSGAAPQGLAPSLRVVRRPRVMLLLLALLPMWTGCKCGERKAAPTVLPSKPAVPSHAEPAPRVVTRAHADARTDAIQETEDVDAIVAAVDAMIQDARSAQPSAAVSAHGDVSAELDALLRDLNALEASLSSDHAQNARLLRELGESGATRAMDRRRVRKRSVPSRSPQKKEM